MGYTREELVSKFLLILVLDFASNNVYTQVQLFQKLLHIFDKNWEVNSPTRVMSQSATAIDVASSLAHGIMCWI